MRMSEDRGRLVVIVTLVICLALAIVGRWIEAARGSQPPNRNAEVVGRVVEAYRDGPATIFRLDIAGERVNYFTFGNEDAFDWTGDSQDKIQVGETLVVGFRLPPPEWQCGQCEISASQITIRDGHVETVDMLISYGDDPFERFNPGDVDRFERCNLEAEKKALVVKELAMAEGASLLILIVMLYKRGRRRLGLR